MGGAGTRGKLKKEQVEDLLAQVLVPVQPNARFIRRLRARLVTIRGGRGFSGWKVVVFLVTILLVAVTLVGLLIRFFAVWIKLIGVIGRKRGDPGEPSSISV